jgi:hypothetical protein
MSGALTLSSYTPSWRGQGTTLRLPIIIIIIIIIIISLVTGLFFLAILLNQQ